MKDTDTGAAPTIRDIVHKLHVKAFLDGEVPNMDYPKEAIAQLEALMQQRELEARIDEHESFPEFAARYAFQLYSLTVDYQDGTNSGVIPARKWLNEAYKKYQIARSQRIAELERQQTEVMRGQNK